MSSAVLLLGLATTTLASAPLHAQTTLPNLQLREQLRIGSVDQGPYALAGVVSVAVERNSGEVFVGMRQASEIRVFSPTGEFVRGFGRAGSGPGEFRSLGRLMWRGDTLVVFDFALSQVSYFTTSGRHLESILVRSQSAVDGLRPASAVARLDNGNILGVPNYGVSNTPDGPGSSLPVVAMDANGNVLRTFDQLKVGMRAVFIPATNGGGGVATMKPIWPESSLSIDPTGSRLLFIHQEIAPDDGAHTFRARLIRADGTVVYNREIGYSPRPVTREFQDSIVGQRLESYERTGAGKRYDPEELRTAFDFPPYHPPVSKAVLGIDGTAWLRREPIGTRVAWWILDAGGALVATALLPMTTEVLAVLDDAAWMVEYDELQVPYVVKYVID